MRIKSIIKNQLIFFLKRSLTNNLKDKNEKENKFNFDKYNST